MTSPCRATNSLPAAKAVVDHPGFTGIDLNRYAYLPDVPLFLHKPAKNDPEIRIVETIPNKQQGGPADRLLNARWNERLISRCADQEVEIVVLGQHHGYQDNPCARENNRPRAS